MALGIFLKAYTIALHTLLRSSVGEMFVGETQRCTIEMAAATLADEEVLCSGEAGVEGMIIKGQGGVRERIGWDRKPRNGST